MAQVRFECEFCGYHVVGGQGLVYLDRDELTNALAAHESGERAQPGDSAYTDARQDRRYAGTDWIPRYAKNRSKATAKWHVAHDYCMPRDPESGERFEQLYELSIKDIYSYPRLLGWTQYFHSMPWFSATDWMEGILFKFAARR